MPLDIATFRKILALDNTDPLSRFGLGQALFQHGKTPEEMEEAAEHLTYANREDPNHLATYHILGQVLIKLGRHEAARSVLIAGCDKAVGVTSGMGMDLGPAMEKLIEQLAAN